MRRAPGLAAALLAAAVAAACGPKPVPVTGLPPAAAPVPAPTPTPAPAPAVAAPVFREVAEPRLDVGVAVDRAGALLVADDVEAYIRRREQDGDELRRRIEAETDSLAFQRRVLEQAGRPPTAPDGRPEPQG